MQLLDVTVESDRVLDRILFAFLNFGDCIVEVCDVVDRTFDHQACHQTLEDLTKMVSIEVRLGAVVLSNRSNMRLVS